MARQLVCGWAGSLVVLLCIATGVQTCRAQDRLYTMPGHDQFARMNWQIPEAGRAAQLSLPGPIFWSKDGDAVEFGLNGGFFHYDIPHRRQVQIEALSGPAFSPNHVSTPERGRQIALEDSPDGKHRAFYKDSNLWIGGANGLNAVAVTTDGSRTARIKYGTASWVYGEELDQKTAFWWSPDSRRIAYYRFDESHVKDYFTPERTLDSQDVIKTEPYPLAGTSNPLVDLYIYNLDTKQTTQVDVRDGKPADDTNVGCYVYDVRWSPDGNTLLFNRANRKQTTVELTACNPANGHCSVVVREAARAGWAELHPEVVYLKDGQRFIYSSERTGFRNYYLYNMSGALLATLTNLAADVERVVSVPEPQNVLFYTAHDGDNPMKRQLHRVSLEGTDDVRLTDPALTHRISASPSGRYFLDQSENHATAPVVSILDENGKGLDVLARADIGKLQALKVPPPEVFTFKGADAQSDCFGMLYRPSNFDPNKRYPLLVSVYAGPETNSVSETFMGRPLRNLETLAEMGFLVAEFDGRGSGGRGSKIRSAVYARLGVVDADDQAAGVKFLRLRPYVDGGRVGIYGTSFGGYMAAMCLLRYPDVFQAACAQSSVTDWRNYDTIYVERYMGMPQENKAAYDAGSALTYAAGLRGRLMLYFGTADDNVHPANTHQLAAALQRAGKSFDLQIGPDQGHSAMNRERMLEFFMDTLVLHSPAVN